LLKKSFVLALDLEGTLIENALSVVPRPGLFDFLEYCKAVFPRIVMMTAVDETTFEEVRAELLQKGFVPDWFGKIEYVRWADMEASEFGRFKDLRCIPFCDEKNAVILDDMEGYIREEQKDRWIYIRPFNVDPNDDEFDSIKKYIDWTYGFENE